MYFSFDLFSHSKYYIYLLQLWYPASWIKPQREEYNGEPQSRAKKAWPAEAEDTAGRSRTRTADPSQFRRPERINRKQRRDKKEKTRVCIV